MLPLRVIGGRLCQACQPVIGRRILDHQERTGWGAKVIDRLASDLREAFPDMKGFSPRNLKYMRAFAAAWPERSIVQEALAQTPWYHHIALLEKLVRHLEKFLLELGQGFAFVGRQYRLDVGGEDITRCQDLQGVRLADALSR